MSSRQGWEESEFPILCETCLGDNPYVKMQKQNHGKECKTCGRPFTVFRWTPGVGMRYKKTEICQTCSKVKNVCQTCVLDLQYGLPVQVRDSILEIKDTVPKSDVNRQFFIAKMDSQLANNESLIDYGKADSAAKELLKKMSRTEPYTQRNKPHICSFFVKGECNRGDECPYRHEQPLPKSELSKQNIKDRYHGENDPVAKKILDKSSGRGGEATLKAPDDLNVTSLYISGIDDDLNELDMREYFETFGPIKSVTMLHKTKGSFINFVDRASAEEAASRSYNNLKIKGKSLKLSWGKTKAGSKNFNYIQKPPRQPQYQNSGQFPEEPPAISSLDMLLNLPVPPPPSGTNAPYYPSMDPSAQGAKSYRP
ncbi:RNA binding motif protein 22 [Clydaea vesicula]|uniref:Pre-mRNA-splicing factor SLT11 n=1 Tax=Clydaea vesicula TaxID=447962 RepID=A0AAD5Y3F2_9FUNG|nr:RNA binding motif protein 22 [Clydaea vesicula]KAJ3383931.1 RNA binding motif protein 22 [Lobulomyces angularis]